MRQTVYVTHVSAMIKNTRKDAAVSSVNASSVTWKKTQPRIRSVARAENALAKTATETNQPHRRVKVMEDKYQRVNRSNESLLVTMSPCEQNVSAINANALIVTLVSLQQKLQIVSANHAYVHRANSRKPQRTYPRLKQLNLQNKNLNRLPSYL